MEKEKLRELIAAHKEKFLVKTGLTRRETQRTIAKFIPAREIVFVTGVRRCGKSSLLRLICADLMREYHVSESNILYLNFEDERFVDFQVSDFSVLYETFLEMENPRGKKYFFLDEIQNVEKWERWLHRLYEFEDIKIFVTGSNASLLGSEISTALTGRNRQVVQWPFSFKEFLALKGADFSEKELLRAENRAAVKKFFQEYSVLGGFPEVILEEDTTLLDQYFKDILYRDVVARRGLRNVREFKELCLYLASNAGAIYSYDNLKNFIRIKSVTSIKNYLDIMEDVFLFFRLPLFDYSVKKQIYNPGKFYAVDTGLSRSISFAFSKNIGRSYENIVFIELKRRNKEFFYWKSKKDREIDFIVREGLKIEEALQVCLTIGDALTRQREMDALRSAREELRPRRLTILTRDEEGREKIGNDTVSIVPLWKWLLQSS